LLTVANSVSLISKTTHAEIVLKDAFLVLIWINVIFVLKDSLKMKAKVIQCVNHVKNTVKAAIYQHR
jgi:hypothetical protein